MIVDYVVVPESVSFQVPATVDSCHPIIEPLPRKPNHRKHDLHTSENNLCGLSDDGDSLEESPADEGKGLRVKPTLTLSPDVGFSSSVFQLLNKSLTQTVNDKSTTDDLPSTDELSVTR